MNRCKGCGAEIVWGKTRNGKSIPLDPKPLVYKTIRDVDHISNRMEVWADVIPGGMVSHFITCPQANKFSGSRPASSIPTREPV